MNSVTLGDCTELMKELPDEFVDLVITDPPFGIDFKAKMNYNRNIDKVLDGYSDVDKSNYYDFTMKWLSQTTRVLKRSGSMYIFSGWNNLKDILIALDECGLVTVNHLVWKYQFGVVTKRKYVTSHYHLLYVCKDDKQRKFYPYRRFDKDAKTEKGGSAHYMDKEDVWYIPREYWRGKMKTPTKLPSEIIRKILSYSSDEGDLVMDPFLGSGQVAVVSNEMGRNYLGYEIVPDYYDFILGRFKNG